MVNFCTLTRWIPPSLLDPSPEETIRTMQSEMRAQITQDIALGLLAQDGEHFIRYTMRGMFYLWFQILCDSVWLLLPPSA